MVESIETASEALALSKATNYSRGVVASNVYIAKVLSETGVFKKALEYLDAAEQEPYLSQAINAQVEISRLKGRAYSSLGMYELGIREFYKQLHSSKQIKSSENERNRALFWAHQNLAHTFSMMDQPDSVWTHLMIQEDLLAKNREEGSFYDFSTTYTAIGKEYIGKKEFSVAREYLDNAQKILRENESAYLYDVFAAYGDLEDALGNQDKAVEYYQMALQNSILNKNKKAEKNRIKVLSDYYFNNNMDTDQTNKYLSRYQALSDSLRLVNSQAVELIIHQFLNKQDTQFKKKTKNNGVVFAIIIIGVIGVVLFLFRKNYQKKIKLSHIEEELTEKEDLVETLVKESSENKFNELIESGRRNDPQFIVLFEELYPEIVAKLKKNDEGIKTSELTFCAMIYLNFSTKEIAEYTFVTVRAVQIRKNRFRKKHQIDSSVDLAEWIRKL